MEKEGLEMLSSSEDLEKMCREVIGKNGEVVESYKSGKEEAMNFLVGQVMRLSKGKANPKETQKILKKLI